MVINPIKTKSTTIATRQKHQLSPLPLDLVLNGAKIDQVTEHRLLGITIDNKLRQEFVRSANAVLQEYLRLREREREENTYARLLKT